MVRGDRKYQPSVCAASASAVLPPWWGRCTGSNPSCKGDGSSAGYFSAETQAGRVEISSLHSFSQLYCWRTRSEASKQFSVFRLELWEVLVQVHWDLPTGATTVLLRILIHHIEMKGLWFRQRLGALLIVLELGFELSLVKPLMLLWALFSCGWVQGMSREQHFVSAWKRWENISWGRFRLSIKI